MKLPEKKLHFCTAGVPLSAKKRSSESGLARLTELGLDGMEMEFVRGVKMGADTAIALGKLAKQSNLVLTAHAPYYINLNAREKEKWHASITRIIQTADRTQLAQGYSICFHAGFYLQMEPDKVYAKVREALELLFKKLDDRGINNVWIRPETTGKPTQFGSLPELIRLSEEFDRMMPCVDYSHLHARSAGKYNTTAEFREVLESMEKALGRTALDNMHIHLSGINYSDKGERNHLILEESDMRWRELLAVWKEFRIKGIVICESPNIEEDALLLKQAYQKL